MCLATANPGLTMVLYSRLMVLFPEWIASLAASGALLPQGEPPALPGWLSEFDISGSMFRAVWARIARVCAAALSGTMTGCEKAPLRGPQP